MNKKNENLDDLLDDYSKDLDLHHQIEAIKRQKEQEKSLDQVIDDIKPESKNEEGTVKVESTGIFSPYNDKAGKTLVHTREYQVDDEQPNDDKDDQQKPNSDSKEDENEQNKKKMYIFLGIIAVVIIIGVVLVGMIIFDGFKSSPTPKPDDKTTSEVVGEKDNKDGDSEPVDNSGEENNITDNQAKIASLTKQKETYESQLSDNEKRLSTKKDDLQEALNAYDDMLSDTNEYLVAKKEAAANVDAYAASLDEAETALYEAQENYNSDSENPDYVAALNEKEEAYNTCLNEYQELDRIAAAASSVYERKKSEAKKLVDDTKQEIKDLETTISNLEKDILKIENDLAKLGA